MIGIRFSVEDWSFLRRTNANLVASKTLTPWALKWKLAMGQGAGCRQVEKRLPEGRQAAGDFSMASSRKFH